MASSKPFRWSEKANQTFIEPVPMYYVSDDNQLVCMALLEIKGGRAYFTTGQNFDIHNQVLAWVFPTPYDAISHKLNHWQQVYDLHIKKASEALNVMQAWNDAARDAYDLQGAVVMGKVCRLGVPGLSDGINVIVDGEVFDAN